MTIEIHQPELEALIRRRMASGQFQSVEDLLLKTLEAPSDEEARPGDSISLIQLFAPVGELFADGELNFGRSLSSGRRVDLF